MEEFIRDYLKIINYSLLGVIFALSSFYLILNYNHYLEIRKDYIINVKEDETYVKVEKQLADINRVNNIDLNNYKGKFSYFEISTFKNKLVDCSKLLNNKTFSNLKNKQQVSIKDMYDLNERLDNEVIGQCVVDNFSFLGRLDNTEENFDNLSLAMIKYTDFPKNTAYIRMLIDNITASNDYMRKDMLNNSSYHFNTDVVNRTLRSNARDNYGEIINIYLKVSTFINELSNWFIEETGGIR